MVHGLAPAARARSIAGIDRGPHRAIRSKHQRRDVGGGQGDRTMLEVGARIALGEDVPGLLQLQGGLEGRGQVEAARDDERPARPGDRSDEIGTGTATPGQRRLQRLAEHLRDAWQVRGERGVREQGSDDSGHRRELGDIALGGRDRELGSRPTGNRELGGGLERRIGRVRDRHGQRSAPPGGLEDRDKIGAAAGLREREEQAVRPVGRRTVDRRDRRRGQGHRPAELGLDQVSSVDGCVVRGSTSNDRDPARLGRPNGIDHGRQCRRVEDQLVFDHLGDLSNLLGHDCHPGDDRTRLSAGSGRRAARIDKRRDEGRLAMDQMMELRA